MASAPLPDLRVRGTGELLDASIKVWGANIKRLAVVTAALVLPFDVAGALVMKILRPTIFDEVKRVQDLASKGVKSDLNLTTRMIVGAIANVVIGSFGTVLVIVAMAFVVSGLYAANGRSARSEAPPRAVIRAVLHRARRVLIAHVSTLLVAALVFIAFAVPIGVLGAFADISVLSVSAGIIGLLAMWIAILSLHAGFPAIATEGAGAVAALRRAVQLTKKRRRMLMAAWLLFSLATVIPAAIVSGMVGSILTGLGGGNQDFDFVWLGIARTIADALCAPIAAIGVTYLYVNLRLLAGEPAFDEPA